MACCSCEWGRKERQTYLKQLTMQQENEFLVEMEKVFEKHGNQGVRLEELHGELKSTGAMETVPHTKLTRMLDEADADKDKNLTFEEFKNMYAKIDRKEKPAMRRFVSAAVQNIVPRSLREDFLANYNCRPPPVFMIVISVIEIGVFIYYADIMARGGRPVTAYEGVPNPNVLMYMPTRRHEAWRFVTYMFVHQGYIHLVFNLFFQLLLGLPLEIVHKWYRVLLVYIAGVVGGSLAHSVTDYNVNLVGASGGCDALIGAHMASVILNWKEMNYKCDKCEPLRIFTSAYFQLAILLLLVVVEMVNAVYRRFFEDDAGKVGLTAHIGGLVTGLLIGFIVLKNINVESWERKLVYVTLTLVPIYFLFCVIHNLVFPGYPETDTSFCC
ncbi:rhomboid-related protein 2-like isoform X2 [Dreissena polymorpha]|uniref:rhomboid-related protein 2-like isoform X2 n=1 Tax=Dreissena polymorpha TaxID=45954 RepID=UPI0022654485|nr:rhomboid-related protein 2-like isoform X2 [Dreissena polymorpha]